MKVSHKALIVALYCLMPSGSASNQDPCTELCRSDGPSICTGGSWNKNGVCHGYHFIGSPAEGRHCYHNSATAQWCLSSSPAVRPADVARILGQRRGVVSTTTTTAFPTRMSFGGDFIAQAGTIRAPAQMYFDGDEEQFEAYIAGLETSTTTRLPDRESNGLPPIGQWDLPTTPSIHQRPKI